MANIGNVNDAEFQAERPGLRHPGPRRLLGGVVRPVPHGLPRGRGDRVGEGRALKVAKLNIDDNPEATRTYGVMSIPSLILFKGGKEVARVVGAKPKDAILKDVEPHLEPQPVV